MVDEPLLHVEFRATLQAFLKAAGQDVAFCIIDGHVSAGFSQTFLARSGGRTSSLGQVRGTAERFPFSNACRCFRPANARYAPAKNFAYTGCAFQILKMKARQVCWQQLFKYAKLQRRNITLMTKAGKGKTNTGKARSPISSVTREGMYALRLYRKQHEIFSLHHVRFCGKGSRPPAFIQTVAEEIWTRQTKTQDIDEKIDSVLKNAPSGNLKTAIRKTSGQKLRLTIEPVKPEGKPILVLDEPTRVRLDMCAVANAVNYMRETGKTGLIITHDLEFNQLDCDIARARLLLLKGTLKR